MNQLVPANANPSAGPTRPSLPSGHFPGGSHSVLDLFQVQKAKKPADEEHKEGQRRPRGSRLGAAVIRRKAKLIYKCSDAVLCNCLRNS